MYYHGAGVPPPPAVPHTLQYVAYPRESFKPVGGHRVFVATHMRKEIPSIKTAAEAFPSTLGYIAVLLPP